MTVKQLIEKDLFPIVWEGEDTDCEISELFCCDLLSIAMSRAPVGSVWVTVMGNMNTLAVASLTEVGCILLAEGAMLDDLAMKKAKEQGITVLKTELPIFKAALQVHELLHD